MPQAAACGPALVASDTCSPLSASSEISACSAGEPRPAATPASAQFVAVVTGGLFVVFLGCGALLFGYRERTR